MKITDKQESFLLRLVQDVGPYTFPFWSMWCLDIQHLHKCTKQEASSYISALISYKALEGSHSEKLNRLEAAKHIQEFLELFAFKSDKVFERRMAKLKV